MSIYHSRMYLIKILKILLVPIETFLSMIFDVQLLTNVYKSREDRRVNFFSTKIQRRVGRVVTVLALMIWVQFLVHTNSI